MQARRASEGMCVGYREATRILLLALRAWMAHCLRAGRRFTSV